MTASDLSLAKQALARQDLELIRRNMARTQRFIARQDISNVARRAAEDRLSDLEFERDTVQMALDSHRLPSVPWASGCGASTNGRRWCLARAGGMQSAALPSKCSASIRSWERRAALPPQTKSRVKGRVLRTRIAPVTRTRLKTTRREKPKIIFHVYPNVEDAW